MPYTGCKIKQLVMIVCFEMDSVSLKETTVRNYLTWLGFACTQLRGSVLAWAWIIGGAEVQCSCGSSWRHHSSRDSPGSFLSSGEHGYRDGGKQNLLFCLVPITDVKERARHNSSWIATSTSMWPFHWRTVSSTEEQNTFQLQFAKWLPMVLLILRPSL